MAGCPGVFFLFIMLVIYLRLKAIWQDFIIFPDILYSAWGFIPDTSTTEMTGAAIMTQGENYEEKQTESSFLTNTNSELNIAVTALQRHQPKACFVYLILLSGTQIKSLLSNLVS